MSKPLKYSLFAVRAVLTAAFLAAGAAKLAGAEMMVATFDAVGVGQWFRYATGAIEVAAAVALWVPGLQAIAAATLTVTMVGAVLVHLIILGPSALPAVVLGALSLFTAYHYRAQIAR